MMISLLKQKRKTKKAAFMAVFYIFQLILIIEL
ncbi:hypothetical protein BX659_10179 [Orenia metallireducens]|uniref:Uncharacterized protein n=1 Tax=Orenia metallireducens TaxID=1413210 RepID=A0A285FXB2_9FIRM|nr:hypothetical protein BX659_10179 [Orenia metallireducens]SNY15895.1 hypothetical protein SAMN06265827_103112 [Orenia metallireducens]